MNQRWKRKGIFFLLALPTFFLLMGLIVKLLWNNTLAVITPVQPINYWQSIGLLILSRILFGGFRFGGPRGGGGMSHPKAQQWRDKWSNMDNEERERFKSEWKKRCKDDSPKNP